MAVTSGADAVKLPDRVAHYIAAIREEGTVPSLLYSLMLHAFVALLALSIYARTRPELTQSRAPIILADLVPLSDLTVSPDAPDKALIAQQRAPETANKRDATAVPVPNDRHTPSPKPHAPLPREKAAARTQSGEAPTRRPQSIGEDNAGAGGDLNARLEALAKLREPPARLPPDPRQQEGEGTSSATVADRTARRGNSASYGVKDFVRAQIERRWYVDRASAPYAAARAQHWTISLHLRLNPDGSVESAEVMNPQMRNETFQTFARSVRNAALLSSPIEIPPGTYDAVKDLVLDFTANDIPG